MKNEDVLYKNEILDYGATNGIEKGDYKTLKAYIQENYP